MASVKNYLIEKRWAFFSVFLGVTLGFISALICIAWNLVIFGFNIMYIVSPLLAGFVETYIARKKYGRSTGAISALLTFMIINGYGWFAPGWIFPKEPVTLSLITLIAILLTIQAAFPTLVNYILFVVVVGTIVRLIVFLLTLPSKITRVKPPEAPGKEEIRQPTVDEIFLDELTIPLLSVPDLNGGKIKRYVGLVAGEAVAEQKSKGRASNLLKMIQPIQLDDLNLGEAKKVALSRMLQRAESMGADAVVEVLIDYLSIGGLKGSATIVTATGTAVIVGEGGNLREKVSGEVPLGDKVSREVPGSTTRKKTAVSEEGGEVSGGSKSNFGIIQKIRRKLSVTLGKSNESGQSRNEKSYPPIEDWDITKSEFENRYSRVSRDVKIDQKFEKQRKYTDKKMDEVKHKLKNLETLEK